MGREKKSQSGSTLPFFVIQKHAASRLHYDFRLEMEGVLKSWAVPKGFPFGKGDKRLAVHVEDHPLEYARFEGAIVPGNYGAGTVMVWDIGSYEVFGTTPLQALEQGKIHFALHGKKLKGEWTLIRLRGSTEPGKENWLILKSGQDVPPISASADDRSVLTRRSMKRIASDNSAQWQSNRPAKDEPPAALPTKKPPPPKPEKRSSRLAQRSDGNKPAFVEPMKALLRDRLPAGKEWIYELKFDGIRALALKHKTETELISRNRKELSDRFPPVAAALKQLQIQSCTIDGEIVALDPEGRSSFQLLQNFNQGIGPRPPLFFYAFDILHLKGEDLRSRPLLERKEILAGALKNAPEVIRLSQPFPASSAQLLEEMKKRGLEGIIAKQKDSAYEAGRRSGAWVKFKWSQEQEFVIGGFTPPAGSRLFFGAILVGFYERGKLLFASKVGSGFDYRLLESLHKQFQALVAPSCPFENLPEKRGGPGLTAREMRHCTWLKPELVAQIRFTEWTRDNHLRHPVFLGLRADKDPRAVRKEVAS